MRTEWMRRSLLAGATLLAWSSAVASVRADEPIVVVVEAHGGEADAQAIRTLLSEELGTDVLSVFDEEGSAARGTLHLAVDYDGDRARVQYQTSDSELVWTIGSIPSEADAKGVWLVEHAVAVVRTAEARREPARMSACLEVIDPWRHEGHAYFDSDDYALPPEVLDPFGEHRRDPVASFRLPPEVIDPWARERAGGADASGETGAPESGRAPR